MKRFSGVLAALGLDLQVHVENAGQNALLILHFAEAISDELVIALGFESKHDAPDYYQIAWGSEGEVEEGPENCLAHLQLCKCWGVLPHKVESDGFHEGDVVIQYNLYFLPTGVVCQQCSTFEGGYAVGLYNTTIDVPQDWTTQMTYDHAARFVICHLLQEVLSALKFQPSAGLDQKIALYDRLAALLQSSTT